MKIRTLDSTSLDFTKLGTNRTLDILALDSFKNLDGVNDIIVTTPLVALVQTGTLTALVQTGTLTALVQTAVA